jgi:hypothetical protein
LPKPLRSARERNAAIMTGETSTAYDLAAQRRDRGGEYACARTHVPHDGVRGETVSAQHINVVCGIEPGLSFMPGDVVGIEVFTSRMHSFVEPPIRHATQSVRFVDLSRRRFARDLLASTPHSRALSAPR